MEGYYLKEKVLARGKKVSIGIDVDRQSWHLSALSESLKPNQKSRSSSHGCP